MHENAWKRKSYYPSHSKAGCVFSGCKSLWIQGVSCIWGLTPLHEIWQFSSAVCFNHLKTISFMAFLFFLIIITVWFTMLLPQQHCNLLSPCLILVSVLLCAPRRRLRARKGPEYTWAADDVAAAFTNHVWEVKERSSSHCSQAWPAGCSCQELVPVSTIIFTGHRESPEKQRVQD